MPGRPLELVVHPPLEPNVQWYIGVCRKNGWPVILDESNLLGFTKAKHLADPELAAEYWAEASTMCCNSLGSEATHKSAVLLRFASTPSYDEGLT